MIRKKILNGSKNGSPRRSSVVIARFAHDPRLDGPPYTCVCCAERITSPEDVDDPLVALVHTRNDLWKEGPVHKMHLHVLGVKPQFVGGRLKRLSDIEAQQEETPAVAAF